MAATDKKIPLVEMFGPTVQGEGAVIGYPTYFLRFGLCDSKCRMCDSWHAVDPVSVKKLSRWETQQGIFEAYMTYRKAFTTHWVTYSGGNPCIHDLSELTSNLVKAKQKIAVETQGTMWQPWLYGCNVVTVSPKGPGMGENTDLDQLDEFMDQINGHGGVNMKIVIFSERDLEFAAMMYERYAMNGAPHRVFGLQYRFYLSLGNPYPPQFDGLQNISDPLLRKVGLQRLLVELYDKLLPDVLNHPVLHEAIFLPQWHVIVWGNKQGV